MTDVFSRKKRSEVMSLIRGKNTRPEMLVRSYLHRHGLRYALHRKDLPGKPDIVLPKYKSVVFVNGCYWHRHPECKYAYTPRSNVKFWEMKFNENTTRDASNIRILRKLGWKVFIIWECQIRLASNLEKLFLDIIATTSD